MRLAAARSADLPQRAVLWWGIGWAMVLFITYATLAPSREVPDLHLNDKLEHTIAFFGLTFWFGGLVTPPRYWRVAVIFSLFGAAIEVAQGTMGLGRDMDFYDWVADSCGAAAALLALWLLVALTRCSWLRWVESRIVPR